MKRINWKKDKLISIKLRNGKFALMQMLEGKGRIVVFNIFKEKNEWDGIVLTKDSILFFAFIISKTIFPRSEISLQKNITPVEDLAFPKVRINTGSGNKKIKVWENTKDEREFIIDGEGNNLLVETHDNTRPEDRYTYTPIDINDYEKYKHLELDNLRIYPEFNERLNICSEINENFDPLKELAFNQKLDLRCRTYIDIIGGQVLLSKLGY